MLTLAFILPAAGALACLALDRLVATRWLGAAAAAALGGAALALAAARAAAGLPLTVLDARWVAFGDLPVRLSLRFDGASWPLALLALAGGGLGVLALARAFPAGLRGYGGLVAAVTAVPLATATALANEDPVLLPFAWVACSAVGAIALRSSGALADEDAVPGLIAAAALGALIGLAAALALRTGPPGAPASATALAAWTLLALLAIGAPLLHAPLGALADAPAGLAAVVAPLGTPLIGGYAILTVAAIQGPLAPAAWREALIILGLLTIVVSGAGALRSDRIRPLIGRLLSAQLGAVLVACGAGGRALTVAAPALLASAALATLALYLALAALERRAGTDAPGEIVGHGPLVLPAVAWLVAAASAAGAPGTLGFWGRLWLVDELRQAAPWAVAPLLAASTLPALALVAPLAALWRATPAGLSPRPGGASALVVAPALAALPLLLTGAAPGPLGWSWLREAQASLAPGAAAAPPQLPGAAGQVASALAAAALVALPLIARRGQPRRPHAEPDVPPAGVLTPAAIGESLGGLAWLGSAERLIGGAWGGLLWGTATLARVLVLFERRYYLAGLLIALIVVVLLFL